MFHFTFKTPPYIKKYSTLPPTLVSSGAERRFLPILLGVCSLFLPSITFPFCRFEIKIPYYVLFLRLCFPTWVVLGRFWYFWLNQAKRKPGLAKIWQKLGFPGFCDFCHLRYFDFGGTVGTPKTKYAILPFLPVWLFWEP